MAKWRLNNGDRADPWGFFPTDRAKVQKCFDCGVDTTGRHHVVPAAKGGTKVIPLCNSCHSTVHGYAVVNSTMIKEGLAKAVARGVKLGAKKKLNNDNIARIQSLRSKGLTIKQIGAEVGLSVGTISKVINADVN